MRQYANLAGYMAITSSAKKAIRAATKRRVFNLARQQAMREAIKEINKLVVTKKTEEALAKLSLAYKAIDKAAKRGVIKPNNAARQKSRLALLVNKG